MTSSKINWPVLKYEFKKAAEGLPEKNHIQFEALIDAIDAQDMHRLIEAFPKLIHQLSGSRTLTMRESARVFNAIDPDHLRCSAWFEEGSPEDLFKQRESDLGVRSRLKGWAQNLPQLLKEIRREVNILSEWKVPDYAGAVVELATELHRAGRLDRVPDEILTLVEQIRLGRFSTSVIPAPPVVSMHVPLRPEAYPDLMKEAEAIEYLRETHRVKACARTLRDRADEPGNDYMRPKEGGGYHRVGLDTAVRRGVLKSRNKGRPRGPAN
jgi:hypothetical protein